MATSVPAPATTSAVKTNVSSATEVRRTPVAMAVSCPPSIAVAATNQPQPWNWGGVTMNVVNTKLSDQPGPQQQMLCFYEGSGSKWYIGRDIQPEFKSCTVANTSSFSCRK